MTAPTLPVTVDPEEAVLGVLLLADLEQAGAILERLRDDDVQDPDRRLVLEEIRAAHADGVAGDPGRIMHGLTRRHGKSAGHRLGLLVAGAYSTAPTPGMGGSFVAELVDRAVRREAERLATRLQQASEGPLDTLLGAWADVADAYTDTLRRVTR